MRIVMLFFVALVIAGGAGFYLWTEMQADAPAAVAEAPKLKEVYVPVAELSAGSILKPEHMRRVPMEDAALTSEMVLADADGEAVLVGSVARQVLAKGVPIARSAVVQPGDRGFLAAVLPQGKRAISIPITEVAGISGLILPGDRVDVILTYSLTGDTIDAARDVRASETVMSNIRVLALDQRLHQPAAAADGKPLGEAPPIARTATLQVSPREAEMITLATSLGDLSLVLNSVHDGGEGFEAPEAAAAGVGQRHMTLDSDVTTLLQQTGSEPAVEAPAALPLVDQILRIQIVRGATAGAIELGEQAVAGAVAGGQVIAAGPGLDDVEEVPAE
jgi:pilus assembly protein CpaB